jgi:hypothetical protein
MTEDKDPRIADLLRADAPPARDPMFRIKVLERREHQQFQQRSFTMLAGVLVIILVSMISISFGRGSIKSAGLLAVGTALTSSYLAFRGRLLRILKRFSL